MADNGAIRSLGFEHWGEILHDEVMAAALLDRLLHARRNQHANEVT